MADSRRIDVTDTNIWIDLDAGGIIHEAFQLLLPFIAPDVVIAELQAPDGRALVSLGLQQEELAGDEVRLVIQLASRYPAPSRVDLFALALAKARGAVLLTGDRHLRKAAEQEKVPVHGTLWYWTNWFDSGPLRPKKRPERWKRCGRREAAYCRMIPSPHRLQKTSD